MKADTRTKKVSRYLTWYEFRKDLVKELGHVPANSLWLLVKPKTPLPWTDLHLQQCLSAVLTLERRKVVEKVKT